jgi:hypothetical protein
MYLKIFMIYKNIMIIKEYFMKKRKKNNILKEELILNIQN